MAHNNKKHTNNTIIFHVILQLFLLSKALETKSIVVYQLLNACPSQSCSLIFSPSDSQNISPLWAQSTVSLSLQSSLMWKTSFFYYSLWVTWDYWLKAFPDARHVHGTRVLKTRRWIYSAFHKDCSQPGLGQITEMSILVISSSHLTDNYCIWMSRS